MKKIFSKLKNASEWYFNAVLETGAMCPSCTVPYIGRIHFTDEKKKEVKNKHSKAA